MYYIRWSHTAFSLLLPMQKALSSKPSGKGRALPWLKISPSNAKAKQSGSCTQIQLLSSSSMEIPSALSLYGQWTKIIYFMDGAHLCSRYIWQSFCAISSTWGCILGLSWKLHFCKKLLSIKCNFSDSACFSRSMIYGSGSTRYLMLLLKHRRTEELGAVLSIPHSHHWIHASCNSLTTTMRYAWYL